MKTLIWIFCSDAMTRLTSLFAGIMLLPCWVTAQHGAVPADTTTESILLREVVVTRKQGIAASNQQKQRAEQQLPTDKVLDRIPGVQLVRRGNYAWEPTLRSLNGGQINVTIDGMHIFGACTDRMDPASSYIEPNNLNRIQTHFGPDFGNYGGGIGGGIDFRVNEASPGETERLGGTLGTRYETNARSVQTLGSLRYSGSRFALDANAVFRQAGNYRSANGLEVPFSQYRKWNAALSARYRLNHHHAVSAGYIQDEGRDIGYPALTMDVAFANAKIASATHHYHRHDRKLTHLKTKVYYNFIDHAMDDTKRPPEQVPMHMDMPGRSWTGGFYQEAMYVSAGNHVLQARISGYRNRLTADMTMYPPEGAPMYMYTLPDAQRSFLGLDFSDKLQLGRLTLTANATGSYHHSSLYSPEGRGQLSGFLTGDPERSDWLWNAGAVAAWWLSPRWQVTVHLARGSRSASLQEYYGFYIFNRLDGFDYLGNIQLSGERSFHTTISAVYDREPVRAEVTGFSYRFSDYIAGRIMPGYEVMTIGANGVKQYMNIGKALLYGSEAALRVRITRGIEFSSIHTYTRGADAAGFALPLIAPFRTVNTLHAAFRGYHAEAEVETAAAQLHVSPERYGESMTPGATVVNLGIRKTYRSRRTEWTAALQVENIADRYYYRHLDIMKIARPGRNVIGSLTVGF